jgi:hypothetical protein
MRVINGSSSMIFEASTLKIDSGAGTDSASITARNNTDGDFFAVTSGGGIGGVKIGTSFTKDANSVLHTQGGDVKFQGLTDDKLFFLKHGTDNVGIGTITPVADSKLHVVGKTVINAVGVTDTLTLGNETVGALRAGIVFNNAQAVPSKIYDRSDGSNNKGLTLQSRDNIFEFIDNTGITTAAEIHVGRLNYVRNISGSLLSKLIIQGATTPNDADDGILFQTADAANAMQDRFNIQADATNVKAYFTNITGLYVGGTGTPTSMVTVNGDIETTGAGEGVIVLDDTNGTRYRIYMSNGVLTTQLA